MKNGWNMRTDGEHCETVEKAVRRPSLRKLFTGALHSLRCAFFLRNVLFYRPPLRGSSVDSGVASSGLASPSETIIYTPRRAPTSSAPQAPLCTVTRRRLRSSSTLRAYITYRTRYTLLQPVRTTRAIWDPTTTAHGHVGNGIRPLQCQQFGAVRPDCTRTHTHILTQHSCTEKYLSPKHRTRL